MAVLQIKIIISAFITIMCIKLFFDVFGEGRTEKKSRTRIYLSFMMLWLGEVIIATVPIPRMISEILSMCLVIATVFIYKKFRLVRIFYLSIFFGFIILSVHLLEEGIRICYGSHVQGNTILSLAGSFISDMLLVLFIFIVYGLDRIRNSAVTMNRQWFAFFIIILNCLLLLCEYMMWEQADMVYYNIVHIVHVLLIGIGAYDLITDSAKKQAQNITNVLINHDAENRLQLYEETVVNQRKRAHEYKNYISCIYYLAEDEKYDELKQFVKGLRSQIYDTDTSWYCSNHIMADTILKAKYREAYAAGIDIEMVHSDLSGSVLGDEDMVVLLSNLFDNAIEAASKCKEDKFIRVEIKAESGHMNVIMENSYCESVMIKGDHFDTTKKEDTENHGYGLSNIKDIVRKYGGGYDITYDKNVFRISIHI